MSGGPVQLMAFGYGPATGAEEQIMAELDALQGRGVLRLLDFLFVQKAADGSLNMLDVGDDEDYGTILSGFFPFDDEDGEPAQADVDPDELTELAESLEPGTAMALVLVEHLWAGGLFSAVERFGGELLSEGFITDEGEVLIGAETQALGEAAVAVEAAHAEETAARLAALRAQADAADAVETAERIRNAAAADALSALIAAGLVEDEAAEEAADALAEAGVITAAVEEAESEAAAEADAAVREAAEIETEAAEEAAAAVGATEAVERAEADALSRAVVESEIAQDAARAEAERIAEAATVQEAAALDEANEVTIDAGLREEAAIEEAEATEEFATRLEAAATLTRAEKRLLNYLSTDLTFAMIADKMKITRGAVKDRAAKVYKKLGVHNRDDAVTAATELGVLKRR